VVGFINAASAQSFAPQLAAFLSGLDEIGYVDGRNVTIEYRWAEGRNDRLPSMAVSVEPVGEFELKGLRRPMAAYNVLSTVETKIQL
jgi:hypothetical protein